MINQLALIYAALNKVEVKGKDNMANLYGAILQLEKMINELQTAANNAEEN